MEKVVITNKNGESITLGNTAPFYLENIDESLGVDIENQKSPNQDGSTYIDNTLDIRAISIEGMIVTRDNPNEVLKCRRKMQRVLNPRIGEVIITYHNEDMVKEIKAIAETTPVFPSGQGNKGIYYQKYLLHLLCHQPFWLDTYYESKCPILWVGLNLDYFAYQLF